LFVFTDSSREDEINQLNDTITSKVSSDTRIFCNYSLSSSADRENLFWYKQTPGSSPRYLLHRMKGYTEELRSDETEARFSSQLDTSQKMTSLTIVNTQLCDSAVYLCALSVFYEYHTMYFMYTIWDILNCFHFFFKFYSMLLLLALTRGDSISPQQAAVSGTEGESVILSCSYTADSQNIYLYWYRQNSNQALEYILQKGARSRSSYSHTADFAKSRFTSTADSSSTTITISKLALSDTAIYHCALRIAQCENSLGHCTKTLSALTGTGP
ncbi:VPRE2 protein, partial [Polyodon spathula]|nr:VPRE2 protein [Polyodon spathula]